MKERVCERPKGEWVQKNKLSITHTHTPLIVNLSEPVLERLGHSLREELGTKGVLDFSMQHPTYVLHIYHE